MEVKKAVKKVVAFAAGATMVGATVLSAMAAADLSSYPAPFVKNGAFDALIVVGNTAAAEDVVGAVDIGASLQYAMRTTKPVTGCAGATPTISNGVAVARSGSYLNYGEKLYDVRDTALTADDLPTVLADGKYVESKGSNKNTATYTQKLYLTNNADSGKFNLFGYPNSPYPSNKDAAEFIYFGNTQTTDIMYTYKLEFDSDVLYANGTTTGVTDLKDTTIEIQGSKFTITDLKTQGQGSNNTISEMTMMAGDTLLWLVQDQKITKTVAGVSHEIQVIDVTTNGDSCGISVDGDVVWIDVGTSDTINGVQVGVVDAKTIHAQLQDQDICQINIGSKELKLRGSTSKIQVDGVNLDSAYGTFTSNVGATNAWRGLTITYTPKDKIFMGIGDEVVDPVFGKWKFLFSGLSNNQYEDLKMEVLSDDKAEFKFANYEGKEVVIPFFLDDTLANTTNANLSLGNLRTQRLLLPGQSYNTTSAGGQVETMLYAVSTGGIARVLKIDSIDIVNKKMSIKDVTYDKVYSEKEYTEGGTKSIDLGSVGTIQLTMSGDNKNLTYAAGPSTETTKTKNEGAIVPSANKTAFTEKDDGESTFVAAPLTFQLSKVVRSAGQGTKLEMDVALATITNSGNVSASAYQKYQVSDVQAVVTPKGTKISYDNKDRKWIAVQHSKKDVVANVFIAPVSAAIAEVSSNIETVSLNKINVGAARLASEITSVEADNLIVVGGPCANKVAATVMGQSGDQCAAGFTEGKAMVKLYEQSTGKVAMLVAGYSAADTRRATNVVADYAKYKSSMKGTEVVVSGTSLADISVKAPQ